MCVFPVKVSLKSGLLLVREGKKTEKKKRRNRIFSSKISLVVMQPFFKVTAIGNWQTGKIKMFTQIFFAKMRHSCLFICLFFKIRLSKFIRIQNKGESRNENETQKIK